MIAIKKVLIFTALVALNVTAVFGQKTELYGALNSGLFSFRGASASKVSSIKVPQIGSPATSQPYGAKNGLTYGVSLKSQRVSKRNFIVGIELGYDNLRSKVSIVQVYTDVILPRPDRNLGKTILSNHFVNASPYLGYRLGTKPVSIDLTAGLEVGYLLGSWEKGKAAGNQITYRASRDRTPENRFDLRPRLQLSATCKRLGLYAGYAHGLTNYLAGYDGGNPEARSRLIRFGLWYKIKG